MGPKLWRCRDLACVPSRRRQPGRAMAQIVGGRHQQAQRHGLVVDMRDCHVEETLGRCSRYLRGGRAGDRSIKGQTDGGRCEWHLAQRLTGL